MMSQRLAFFLIFQALGFILYFPTIDDPFLLDDFPQIVDNRLVQNLANVKEFFKGSTIATPDGTALGGIYYKPIMTLSYSFLWNLGNGSPQAFHVFQIFLHSACAFLMLLALFNLGFSWIGSSFAALVFLVHPLNTEAAVLIADLQEPLYTIFGLGALLMLMESMNQRSLGTIKLSLRIFFINLLLLGALLSKETGLLYILVALFYVILEQRVSPISKWKLGFCFGMTLAIYIGLRVGLAGLIHTNSDSMQIMRADLVTRLQTVPAVLWHYISSFFLPLEFSLTQDWVIRSPDLKNFFLPLTGVLAMLTVVLLLLLRTKSLRFRLCAYWFLLGWLFHSQIFPLDGTVSDRWFYFTMPGFLGVLLFGLEKLFLASSSTPTASEMKKSQLAKLLGATILILIMARAHTRALDFASPLTLYQAEFAVQPESFYVNNNLALELLKARRFEESLPHFQKTISESEPNSRAWHIGHRNLATAWIELGKFEEAAQHLRIAVGDNDPKSFLAVVMWYQRQKDFSGLVQFLQNDAIPRFPQDPLFPRILNETRVFLESSGWEKK